MPSGMRNATPGPSALERNAHAHGAGGSNGGGIAQGRSNVVKKKEERQKVLKRPSSEEILGDEGRERKKGRFVEGFDDDDAINSRDNKEKRRKKKKKKKKPISVVVSGTSQPSEQGLGLHTLVNGSHSQVTARVDVNGVKVDDKGDDEAPTYSSSDKGKGRAKPVMHENPNLGSGSTPTSDTRSTTLEGSDQSPEVARLKEQLAEQRKLLERHQSHLNQHQQALTCQICLDLLHRPYALIPCGHVTCYGCLVRWFTSDLNADEPIPDVQQQQADEDDHSNGNELTALLNSAAAERGTFVRRRKTCPVCRGVVPDRPVEMWDIKQMVAALVKSHLVDLPLPPGSEVGEESNIAHGNNTPNDPWRNLFKPVGSGRGNHRRGGPPPPGQEDGEEERAQFGWYDHEDGGVYRCVECLHELWGGMCTGCERIYLGHEDDDEEEEDASSHDDDDDDEIGALMYLRDELSRRLGVDEDEDEDEDVDDAYDHNGEYRPDEVFHVDVEGPWSLRGDLEGEGDIDFESSEGFIDDEERIRSGGLSGVGDVSVFSEEEAGSEPLTWARGRNLRARRLLEEEEGTSGLDEGSDLDIDDRMGWGGDNRRDAVNHTDEENSRSPGPILQRITPRRTLAAPGSYHYESSRSSSDDESERHSPPRLRSARLFAFQRRALESDSEDEADSEEDDGPMIFVRRPAVEDYIVDEDALSYRAGLRRRARGGMGYILRSP